MDPDPTGFICLIHFFVLNTDPKSPIGVMDIFSFFI